MTPILTLTPILTPISSPHAGAKAICHGTRFQNFSQLLALACGDSRRTAGAMSLQDSLHPLFSPALQPQANVRVVGSSPTKASSSPCRKNTRRHPNRHRPPLLRLDNFHQLARKKFPGKTSRLDVARDGIEPPTRGQNRKNKK